MAVVSELIDAGLKLKAQGKLKGAIEHFRQLHATYPENARIMYQLAVCWTAFGVPEQALPLYRALLALPRGQGLPARDLPRLYTRLGAALAELGEDDEALAVFNDGLAQHPSYRPLRAFRIYAHAKVGELDEALVDAMDLMLESLAPSRWDVFEDEIRALVDELRVDEPGSMAASAAPADKIDLKGDAKPRLPERKRIEVEGEDASKSSVELEVRLGKSTPKPGKKAARGGQFGKKAVRIDISGKADEVDDSGAKAGDDNASRLRIPLDPD